MGGLSRRLRVAPWQGDRFVALVGPVRTGQLPAPTDIDRCLATLLQRGVSRAVTPALSPFEAEPFYQAGFELLERLHLLSCRLDEASSGPVDSPARSRPGRPWHDAAVLEVDRRAFSGFWRFDRLALKEAKTATPSRRFRVARLNGDIVGYAVTGRAGPRGYLQRLAVDPAVQGQGVGSMLVNDSFDWLRRRGAEETLVNTQETNETALRLYERLGYRRHTQGLLVLRWAGET
jgi:ribosomal protein S18 acetylase RimI-like enzyme